MVESKVHRALKKDTVDVLKKLGYDVNTNVELTGPRGGKRTVDIIAESAGGQRVALEVGKLSTTKYDQLNRNYGFDQILHVPDNESMRTAIQALGSNENVLFSDAGRDIEMEAIEESGLIILDNFWDTESGGTPERTVQAKLNSFQLLRDQFGLVTTGVELYISYSVGNGYTTTCTCDDFKTNNECEHTDAVNDFGEDMDLDEHIQGLADRALTWGFCLEEIVYKNTDSYLDTEEMPKMEDLGTITELKIIDAIEHRIDAIREASYPLKYYVIDGEEVENPDQTNKGVSISGGTKLYPWMSGLATWNVRKPNLFGESIIVPTKQYVEWLLNIQKSYAKGVYRQGNPIPIFVAKNWGKKKVQALRSVIKKREQSGGMGALVFSGEIEASLLGTEGAMLSRQEAFDHYTEMIASAMTIPSFFFNISKSGRSEPVEKQMELFLTRVGRFARMMKRYVEKRYFKYIIEHEFGEDAPVPRIIWNSSVVRKDKDTQELRQLLTVRYLSPELREAAERRIATVMGLKIPSKLTILTLKEGTITDEPEENEDNEGNDDEEGGK